MYYAEVNAKDNKRNLISVWKGYNHNPIIGLGELYDTKNLSLDRYPLLSARKKRAVELSLYNEEYMKLTPTVKATYHGEITEVNATYTYSFEVAEKNEFTLKYNVDKSIIKTTSLLVRYLNGEELIDSVTKINVEGFEGLTPDNTTKVDVQLLVWPIDKENFKEEDLDKYVTGTEVTIRVQDVRGILIKDSKLAYFIRTVLYYDGQTFDFDEFVDEKDHTSKQQLINFGVNILIFPLGLFYNTLTGAYGSLEEKVEVENTEVTYSICTVDGEGIDAIVSDEEPTSPTDGQYWLDTRVESKGLYRWAKATAMWTAVATTYMSIKIPGVEMPFNEGDAVFMNTPIEDINNGSVIRKVGEDYIVVTGLIEEEIKSSEPLTIMRKLPKLDFVCVSLNRVWGCYKGDGVNEIYASKLGDASNFYVYDGLASDSYALSLGDDGDFTGCISYRGYPYFFKENVVYQVYGSYPATYQLNTYECRGVQKGSHNSLAVVGEYLMYKAVNAVCVFDGYSPTIVSDYLGYANYSKAAAGAAGNKYYISMHNDTEGIYELFVYDIEKAMWIKEDNLKIEQFAFNKSSQLYGHNSLTVYGFEMAVDTLKQFNTIEEYVDWEACTGIFGLDQPDMLYPCKFALRADMPVEANVDVLISYDDAPFEILKTVRVSPSSQLVKFTTKRCDHFRVKFTGRGDVKIYSLAYSYDTGSDEE